MAAAPQITFLASRFPNTSETFIQAQVEGLLERGVAVDMVALACGDTRQIVAKWGGRLRVHDVRVGKTLLTRLFAIGEAIKDSQARPAFNPLRYGYEAIVLRLPLAVARWPLPPERRVWLAHFGRWGAFAASLRSLGLIEGPIATVFHGKDMSAYLRRHPNAYRRLLQEGELFLPISEAWRRVLIEKGAPPARTMVHRMGVDTRRFAERPRVLAAGEPVRFIGVGRMVEKKGFDDAIAAFAAYRATAKAPPATLTLIGGGPLKGRLQAQARKAGVAEFVRFTGVMKHDKVAAALDEAHIFVLPSKTARNGDMEGLPVALMEAQAMAMPVLTTRHSGIPELVGHNVSGLLCEEGDRAGLCANMLALARWPERWSAMGAAGARRVREEFDLAVWNDRLAERLSVLAKNA
jgi:colanic acid/amylovoran/stewartan biosynthesis glycosyltransferase WcaL/AmsK/CpsK